MFYLVFFRRFRPPSALVLVAAFSFCVEGSSRGFLDLGTLRWGGTPLGFLVAFGLLHSLFGSAGEVLPVGLLASG